MDTGVFFQEEKSLTLLFFIRIKGHHNNHPVKTGYIMSLHLGVQPRGMEHQILQKPISKLSHHMRFITHPHLASAKGTALQSDKDDSIQKHTKLCHITTHTCHDVNG